MDIKERRHFRRIQFVSSITLVKDDKRWECKLLDISLKGVLVQYPNDWNGANGDRFDLELALGEGSVVIAGEVEIVHIHDKSAGLRFDSIEVDGLMHLRKLMELNIGDADLISREIGELGKS